MLAVLACAAGLGACGSISEKVASTASTMPAIGLPAGTPERTPEPPAFPPVHDMPPQRDSVLLNDVQQQKLEDDLVAARNQQQTAAGITPVKTAKPEKPKPKVTPVSSSQTIY